MKTGYLLEYNLLIFFFLLFKHIIIFHFVGIFDSMRISPVVLLLVHSLGKCSVCFYRKVSNLPPRALTIRLPFYVNLIILTYHF